MERKNVYYLDGNRRTDYIAEFYPEYGTIFVCSEPQTEENADDVENVVLVLEQSDFDEPIENIWNRMPEDITDWEDRF